MDPDHSLLAPFPEPVIALSDVSPWIVAWCFLALMSGGLVKGALGVGTPLLPVPLMSLVLPPQLAVVMMAIPVVVANLVQVSEAGNPVYTLRRFWPAFVMLLLGTWVGVRILAVIDERWLLGIVGVTVIAFALLQASSRRFHIPPGLEKATGGVFGCAAGIIGGLSSMFGPMLIIYLVSIPDLVKDRFVGSISFLYIAAVIPWTINLFFFVLIDTANLILSSLALVPVTLFLMIVKRLRSRISEVRFRLLVIAILVLSGITMLWRAAQ